MGRRPIHVDAARLEALARVQPTQAAVAMELGISQQTLVRKLFEQPELRQAYERGRAERAAVEGNTRRPFCRTTRFADSTSVSDSAPPPPVPAQRQLPAAALIVEALGRGGLTYGGLMHATRLDHHQLVAEVQRLKTAGRVRSTEVGGELRHFLVVSLPPLEPVEDVAAGERGVAP